MKYTKYSVNILKLRTEITDRTQVEEYRKWSTRLLYTILDNAITGILKKESIIEFVFDEYNAELDHLIDDLDELKIFVEPHSIVSNRP